MTIRRGRGRVLATGVGALVVCVWAAGCGREAAPAPESGSGLSLVGTLGGVDTAGYARADGPRTFDFPSDHGPHPDFRTEWWYVTGNVSAPDGRDFGFQFTIFRAALAPVGGTSASAWSTNQAYMGHLTVTEVSTGRFRAEERFARGVPWLAGADADPFRVYLEDWVLESVEPSAEAAPFPMRLAGEVDGARLDLVMDTGKPLVLQGDRGLSQKGPEVGNASYYYAHTRMPVAGRLVLDGDSVAVEGLAWLDREWSTSALSPGQVGWDWLALQLDDGWEMMVYQLRREDGRADPLSDGVLIDPSGRKVPLVWGRDVEVTVDDEWSSPVDGVRYPARWRIRVPGRGWDLTVEPAVADQELRFAFRYWEGSVRVEGAGEGGVAVEGRGYVELTGYAEAPR